MTGFTGKILVEGHVAMETSAFKKTDWDTDKPILPAQTAMAFKKTDWDTDDSNAESRVAGFTNSTDEWA